MDLKVSSLKSIFNFVKYNSVYCKQCGLKTRLRFGNKNCNMIGLLHQKWNSSAVINAVKTPDCEF